MIFTFLYILLTALGSVVDHSLGLKLPNMLMVFLTTAYAILFFNVINYKTMASVYQRLWNMKKFYASLLVIVAILWLGTFYLPIYYSPTILMFTFMAWISFYGAVFSYRHNKKRRDLIEAVAILSILILFYVIYFQYYSRLSFLIMLAGTFVTGTVAYVYMINSHKLHDLEFSPTQVLAARYWLLLAIPIVPIIKDQQYLALNWQILGETLFLSVIMLIIPVYCIQKAIQKIGSDLAAVLIGFTPLATFLIEKIHLPIHDNSTIGYLSLALALAIIMPYLFLYSRNKIKLHVH